jgi:hypothetical protein
VTAILNKPDLSAYATDTELANGLATKQNVISDLDSIRSGAALGATAAQPSDLPSTDELLPSATSGDSGKVLTVDSNGDPSWQPAQGGASVEAGAGLVKSGDTLSVNAYRGLRIGEPMSSFSIDSSNKFFTTPYFRNMASQVKCLCSTEASTSASWYGTTTAHIVIANADNAVYGVSTVEFEAGRYYESSTYLPRSLYVPITFDASNFTMNEGHTFSDLGDNYATVNVFVTLKGTTGSSETPNGEQPLYDNKAYLSTLTSLNEIFYPTTEPPTGQRSFLTADYFNGMYSPFWNVAYPKPTSADAGKVLKVNASGNIEWSTDGFTTTAGITDIQQVAALPANPVATVLYLIPET